MQVKRAWITEGRLRVGELLCIYNINYVALSLSLFNLLTRPLNHSCSVTASVQSSWSFRNINLQCSEFVFIKLSRSSTILLCRTASTLMHTLPNNTYESSSLQLEHEYFKVPSLLPQPLFIIQRNAYLPRILWWPTYLAANILALT